MINFQKSNIELPKEEKYRLLISKVEPLVENEDNFIANVSNITSAIKFSFEDFSWVGFYFVDEKNPGQLVLGPFQGKVACTRIAVGKGVCGTAYERKQTIIVPDVSKFPGHICCDADSKSEIVIPIIIKGTVKGVLDIDSYKINNFDEVDKKYFELLMNNIFFIFKNE